MDGVGADFDFNEIAWIKHHNSSYHSCSNILKIHQCLLFTLWLGWQDNLVEIGSIISFIELEMEIGKIM